MYPAGVYIAVSPDEVTAKAITEFQEKYLKGQDINEELHCTLIYSKEPYKEEIEPESYNAVGTFKGFNLFGPENDTLVIEVESQDLTNRNAKLVEKYGFISDFDEYRSHITLSYKFTGDINSLPDIDFMFTLCDEYVEPLDEDWASKK